MNKKKVVATLLSLAFLTSCVAPAAKINSVKEKDEVVVENVATEIDTRKVNTDPYLVKNYESIEELNADSNFGIVGTIVSNETVMLKEHFFTISTVKVEKSLKGDIKEGTIIKLLQDGGIESEELKKDLPKKEFEDETQVEEFEKENEGKLTEILIYNSEVLKPNQKCILYLNKYEDYEVEGDLYIAEGGFQGRFKVDKDGKVTPQSENIKDCPKTAAELEEEITK